MLVAGAGGNAKEVLLILEEEYQDIKFFQNDNKDLQEKLYNKYDILSSLNKVMEYFKIDSKFVLGVGDPGLRKSFFNLLVKIGGTPTTIISNSCKVGTYNVKIEEGVVLMWGVMITNDISIGKGSILNAKSAVGHGSTIGEFVNISPGVIITGDVTIGNNCVIGSSSTIIPKVKIGDNCIVSAGSVVKFDIPENSLVAGNPAKIIPTLKY
jgi:sugar O-acyltransferase (sialic acid O-acetyltransferase NeuD family)